MSETHNSAANGGGADAPASHDAQSTTSSMGHEDYFEKELRSFIRQNRNAVAKQNKLMRDAEKKASSTVASLADKRARLEESTSTREAAIENALASSDTPDARKTDLRLKLDKLQKKKAALASELDKKAKAADDALAARKRKWSVFMGNYEDAKEKEESRAMQSASNAKFAQFRAMEYLKRSETRKPVDGDTQLERDKYAADMRELAHLRNIRQAQENYSTYVQQVRQGGAPAKKAPQQLLPIQRIKVSAPKATDPPMKRTRLVSKPAKMRDDAFEMAARQIAEYVQDWKEMDDPSVATEHPEDGEEAEDEGRADTPDDCKFVHETQLKECLRPEALLTNDWATPLDAADLVAPGQDGPDPVLGMTQQLLMQQEVQLRITHLHSLALARCVTLINDVKALVVGDVQKDKETANMMKKANQVVLLASDPLLRRLPFKTIREISAFMTKPDNVEKLTLYLLNFHPYVEKTYAATLISALLHPDLQQAVFWSYGIPKPRSARDDSGLSLPRVFEVYLLRYASAAHNVAHFHLQCDFDENAFSEKMKVGLYNSKRNMQKRSKGRTAKPSSTATAPKAVDAAVEDHPKTAKAGPSPPGNVPAPTEPGNQAQEHAAAEVVAHCLEVATKGGKSFTCNVRLIRSAVFRRDPQGKNRPLQNALRALLHGVRKNDVAETKDALQKLREEQDLGLNM